MTAAGLWERLQADGLVEGDGPPPQRAASPWFVRVMLGIAGWIGAAFLLAFVGAAFAFVMEGAAPAIVVGAACCGGAFALFRAFDGNDFAEQFGLAVSLAGQVLIGIGLGQALQGDTIAFYLAIAAVEALLALAVPNFLHRVLATGAAAAALALAVNALALQGLAAPLLCLGLALVWLEPSLWAAGGRLWRPIGYGLLLALLLVETFRLFDAQSWLGTTGGAPGWMQLHGPLLGRAATAAVLAWTAVTLARRQHPPPARRVVLAAGAAAALFGLLALPAPGLASAVLILLLGFAAGNRLLLALGILSLLGFVSHFYYSLHATLLAKSGLLAVTGLVLLAAYGALRLFARPLARQEAGDA